MLTGRDGPNILIVDDKPANIIALEAVLNSTNYRILPAASGQEALAILEKEEIALILLDIQMPRLDGDKACQHIKEHSDVPVMLISGLGDTATRALIAGADSFLHKPFSLDDLYANITALLSGRTTSAASTAAFAGLAA